MAKRGQELSVFRQPCHPPSLSFLLFRWSCATTSAGLSTRGGHVYPVAEQMLARGIPFLLASGYGGWALPEHLQDRPRLTKPFTDHDLEEQVRLLCRRQH
ncbi:response regulator [Geminicoccus harenae]|uniref:hypothetical protein n=1 Tax=Geminicoccus harenae TaxID=2498453 RepID=UPI00168B0F42|nr:hypothetical protein [Geminicoccus harenae]